METYHALTSIAPSQPPTGVTADHAITTTTGPSASCAAMRCYAGWRRMANAPPPTPCGATGTTS